LKSLLSFSLLLSIIANSPSLAADTFVTQAEQDQYLPDYNPRRSRIAQSTAHYLHSLFWTKYAPIKWKQKRYGWDPDIAFEQCMNRLNEIKTWDIDTLKPIFSSFIYSCQDVHTALLYDDSRMAYIPVEADYVEGRFIITESSLYNVLPGDEVLSINGDTPLSHIKKAFYGSDQIEEARPYFLLDHTFHRMGMFMATPKKGEHLTLSILHQGQIKKVKLDWHITRYHTPSNLEAYQQRPSDLDLRSISLKSHLSKIDLPLRCMPLNPQQRQQLKAAYHQALFNEKLAEHSFDNSKLDWHLFKEEGIDVAYMKLDSFNEIDFTQVDIALKMLEKKSDCMVLDLRKNPGGIDLCMYALAMRMTCKPLLNLMYSCILDVGLVEMHRGWLEEYDDLLDSAYCDHEMEGFMEEYGLPWSLELIRSLRQESLQFIEEWEQGYTCTRFSPMRGIRFIEPHPSIRYSKPLYILIDERCASCADIFPALMKDNARAILLGRTTSGAGGTVEHFPIINAIGISEIDMTTSLVLRNNLKIIEDNGVSPDFEHKKTVQSTLDEREEKMKAIRFAAEHFKSHN
jgi:hypothetical protein